MNVGRVYNIILLLLSLFEMPTVILFVIACILLFTNNNSDLPQRRKYTQYDSKFFVMILCIVIPNKQPNRVNAQSKPKK